MFGKRRAGDSGRCVLCSRCPLARTEFEVRVTLVIPKQDVEARLLRLDEVVFQQQGLCFRAHHRGFHAHNLADHVADAGAIVALGEVT